MCHWVMWEQEQTLRATATLSVICTMEMDVSADSEQKPNETMRELETMGAHMTNRGE